MKANEAPERIYCESDGLGNIDRAHNIKWPDDEAENVEYTRTDAFIEKACEWLRTHSEVDYFELIPDANYCGAGNLNKKRMIEDFRNYMKGE